jgi:hypothetical protein
MRRFSVARGVVVVSFAVLVALNASAAQNGTEVRERIGVKERVEKIVRVVKRAVKSLGDGLTRPRP